MSSALSTKQLRILGMEATQAFDLVAKHDALDLPAEVASCSKSAQRDFWRQRVCAEVTGFVSFKDLNQDHYRPLLSRFQALAGHSGAAFKTQLREERHTAATTPQGAGLLRDLWQHAAEAGLGAEYVKIIVRGKTRGQTSDVNELSMTMLQQVHDTVLKRARSKLKARQGGPESESPSLPASTSPSLPRKVREYVLRPRSARVHSTATQPSNPDNEPF